MTAERDPMTLSESTVPALGGEERSDEAPRAGRARPTPDPEVVAKPKRRQFSAQYRLRILEEADRCIRQNSWARSDVSRRNRSATGGPQRSQRSACCATPNSVPRRSIVTGNKLAGIPLLCAVCAIPRTWSTHSRLSTSVDSASTTTAVNSESSQLIGNGVSASGADSLRSRTLIPWPALIARPIKIAAEVPAEPVRNLPATLKRRVPHHI